MQSEHVVKVWETPCRVVWSESLGPLGKPSATAAAKQFEQKTEPRAAQRFSAGARRQAIKPKRGWLQSPSRPKRSGNGDAHARPSTHASTSI